MRQPGLRQPRGQPLRPLQSRTIVSATHCARCAPAAWVEDCRTSSSCRACSPRRRAWPRATHPRRLQLARSLVQHVACRRAGVNTATAVAVELTRGNVSLWPCLVRFGSCGKACQKAHWSAGHKYGCTSGWCGVGVPKADLGGSEAQAEPTRDDTELNERLRVWALTKGITKCKFMDGDDDDPLVA